MCDRGRVGEEVKYRNGKHLKKTLFLFSSTINDPRGVAPAPSFAFCVGLQPAFSTTGRNKCSEEEEQLGELTDITYRQQREDRQTDNGACSSCCILDMTRQTDLGVIELVRASDLS